MEFKEVSERGSLLLVSSTPPEFRSDEVIQVSIQDILRITPLNIGAQVFHHFVGMENVTSDLRSKICALRCSLQALQRGGIFLLFFLQQFRPDDFHRLLPILTLGTFILTGSDDAARDMRDAHRAFGLIHMLS